MITDQQQPGDHRSLGEALGLFHFQDEAPGCPFWHPRGMSLLKRVEDHVRQRMAADGYQEVRTPQMMARSLWEQSGHWDLYGGNMFVLGDENRRMAVKPMNCPGHVQVFRHGVRSWRDLPMRYAEFGVCHRDEPSGALHGLMRLRAFTQDDGHVFCRPDQVRGEVARFCRLVSRLYRDFGFSDFGVALSLRPDVRAGSDDVWDRAEEALADAAAAAGLSPARAPGEGAFYGPKLEFSLKDSRGRAWQCGTIQLDMVLPARLGAAYAAADGSKQPAVILHRAALGSLERFIGILLEHHGGDLPMWLAPEQVLVATISERQAGWAREVADRLSAAGLRVRLDDGSDRIAAKVRGAALLRIPAVAVVGEREASAGALDVRMGGERRGLPLAAAAEALASAAAAP